MSTAATDLEWQTVLRALEQRLARLADGGAAWLSVAADAEAAALLDRIAEVRPGPPVEPPLPVAGPAGPPQGAMPGTPRGRGRNIAAWLEEQGGVTGEAPRTPEPGAARRSPAAQPRSGGPVAAAPEGEAPPLPAEIGTLESLQFQYRDCRRCGLAGTRNRLVFGVGNEHPRLMFVGEGPGADEDAQGLPFVGRAGRLLTGLITAAGLRREDVYITNVVKCRPPGNRNPAPDEVASCRPILQRQIELLDPALIVSLGNVPLKVFNPRARGITSERGRPFAYERWRVLPTFHPSYLLRNPAAIGDCWRDFRAALELAYGEG